MIKTTVYATIILSVFLCESYGQNSARNRIGYRGNIVRGIEGLPKWNAKKSTINRTVPGDLFILETDIRPREGLAVAVYAHFTKLEKQRGQLVPVGKRMRVPASAMGRSWGYESTKFSSAGSWTMLFNDSDFNGKVKTNVFFPYAAMKLTKGDQVQLEYEVAVTVKGQTVDSFFISEYYNVLVTDSGLPITGEITVEDFQGGVLVDEFHLIGAEPDGLDVP